MKKPLKKTLKRANKTVLLYLMLFLVLGIASGYSASLHLTKDDKFELLGDKNINLNLNETYNELGASVISFGKNLDDKIHIESNVDTSKEGEYVVIYTVNSLKYKDIRRVRYVTVKAGEVNE